MGKHRNTNVSLLLVLIITTIDASRIFYLPLPKIHPTQQELKPPSTSQKSEDQQSINNDFRSLSKIDYKRENKKRDLFDWDDLMKKERVTRRRLIVNEHSPENRNKIDYYSFLKSDFRQLTDADTDAAIDTLVKLNENHKIDEPWVEDTATSRAERLQSNPTVNDIERSKRRNDTLFLAIVGICSLVGVMGLVAAAIFWYKIQKRAEAAADSEYPSYGVTGPSGGGGKISPSSTLTDRKLAQSAQMFHYQQQRQQMMAQEKAPYDTKPVQSDDSDDETHAGGDYTVYECPGLAPTGEMEVRNPLFAEPDSSLNASTSSSHPTTNNHYPQLSSSPSKEKSLS